MLRIIAKNFIKPEEIAKAEPIFRELVAESLKDSGCLEYRLHKDAAEPGLYVFIEEWADRESHAKHEASEHFKRLLPQIGALAAKPGEALFLHDEVKG
jgi:quinol monooxygenase YgiN